MLSWDISENRNMFSQCKTEMIQQERFFMPTSSWASRQGCLFGHRLADDDVGKGAYVTEG